MEDMGFRRSSVSSICTNIYTTLLSFRLTFMVFTYPICIILYYKVLLG